MTLETDHKNKCKITQTSTDINRMHFALINKSLSYSLLKILKPDFLVK